jgi:hypothetical protein
VDDFLASVNYLNCVAAGNAATTTSTISATAA